MVALSYMVKMGFKKGNKKGGNKKLTSFDTLDNEVTLYIQQQIQKGAGYKKIKQLLMRDHGINISVPELRQNVETKWLNHEWVQPNKIKRVPKVTIDAWMDASTLQYTYRNKRPKKSRTLYIEEFTKMFKLYAYTDRDGNKEWVVKCTESSGEKGEHFKELLTKVALKGYLDGVKRMSIDSQVNADEIKELKNIELVRQEKGTAHPYQSEVEGIFGLKNIFIKWLESFDYIQKKERRSYNISEKQVIDEIEWIRKNYLQKIEETAPEQKEVLVAHQKVTTKVVK